MIAGYVDSELHIFCVACWPKRSCRDLQPHIILDPERDDDVHEDFWITDRCERCGGELRYQRCVLIGPAPWVVP